MIRDLAARKGEVELETRRRLDRFLETVEHASRRLLMLDYDGTIAPLQKERDQVYPYPGIAAVIPEIMKHGRTRVAIVTGRDVNELIPRLGMQPVPELRGLYGMQRRRPGGAVETTAVKQSYLDALSDAMRWLEYQDLQEIAEVKPGGIAAHWRGLTERKAQEMHARVLLGWERIADRTGLQLLEFDGGMEIRAPGADKGDVVRSLLAEEGVEVAAAYLGDDLSDEAAFRAMGDRGLSVLVGTQWRQTAAQLWLKPPDEVLDFLEKWLSVCRKNNASGDTTAMAVNT
ncbi:MAG: trehalose-phosphatase [Terriglobales bacterium]